MKRMRRGDARTADARRASARAARGSPRSNAACASAWSASGVYGLPFTKNKKNMHVYMLAGGSHKTRILSFPEPTREEIISLIRGWLNE